MGCFGLEPFQNDYALDLLAEVGEQGATKIRQSIQDLDDCFPDTRSAARLVAAAYLVVLSYQKESAKQHSKLLSASSVDLAAIAKKHDESIIQDLLIGIQRIDDPKCELYQEWRDAGLLKEWQSVLAGIAVKLNLLS